ncbi:MAG: hypothetical protein HY707_04235 [Ignavibacteriae bacterium]|nr:hypothetical protein [Ignavibacteriota bacterium]
MNILLLINDAPYGTEKAYNALRSATTLQEDHRVFQMVESVLGKGGKQSACDLMRDVFIEPHAH